MKDMDFAFARARFSRGMKFRSQITRLHQQCLFEATCLLDYCQVPRDLFKWGSEVALYYFCSFRFHTLSWASPCLSAAFASTLHCHQLGIQTHCHSPSSTASQFIALTSFSKSSRSLATLHVTFWQRGANCPQHEFEQSDLSPFHLSPHYIL